MAKVGSLLSDSAKLTHTWKSTSKLKLTLRNYLCTANESRQENQDTRGNCTAHVPEDEVNISIKCRIKK
ncbi:hypothetical protein BFS15_03730 [Gardnerella sp. DNF01162]|nr:hypothetical protein CJ215_03440 [Gardnerella vaginalis]PNP90686.1 hypothetical protein BFS15_03730 [Gardnerella sp. DNF01162]RFT32578.1 hypothetical protein CG402_07165 [Bifidobacteriaceae bacterium NR020]RIY30413.1 hypothetical protein CJI49_03995 [Bifidobacteriaceae bacterium NR016]